MSDFDTWKILPDDGEWVIRCQNEAGIEDRFEDQEAALEEAQRLAQRDRPGQVILHRIDGSVLAAIHYHGLYEDAEPEELSTTEHDLIKPRA